MPYENNSTRDHMEIESNKILRRVKNCHQETTRSCDILLSLSGTLARQYDYKIYSSIGVTTHVGVTSMKVLGEVYISGTGHVECCVLLISQGLFGRGKGQEGYG